MKSLETPAPKQQPQTTQVAAADDEDPLDAYMATLGSSSSSSSSSAAASAKGKKTARVDLDNEEEDAAMDKTLSKRRKLAHSMQSAGSHAPQAQAVSAQGSAAGSKRAGIGTGEQARTTCAFSRWFSRIGELGDARVEIRWGLETRRWRW